MNSILGLYTVDSNSIVIDEDEYGRRMFIYWGDSNLGAETWMSNAPVYAILISQKTEGGYVYYYPDFNFFLLKGIPLKAEIAHDEEETIKYILSHDLEDEIEQLKTLNDWGRPLDESKWISIQVMSRAEIERRIDYTVPYTYFDGVFAYVSNSPDITRAGFYYLTSDDYNRHIFFFRALYQDEFYKEAYVVIFNEDYSFDPVNGIMEITDVWNYQEELKTFKERNGWNTAPDAFSAARR